MDQIGSKKTIPRNHKVDGTHPNRMLSCLCNFIARQYNTFNTFMYSFADPGRGASDACTHYSQRFSQFHAVFLEHLAKMYMPPGGLTPTPVGNPGSGSGIYSRIEYTHFSQVRQSLQFCEMFSQMVQQQRH